MATQGLWPQLDTLEDLERIRYDDSRFQRGVEAICDRHALPASAVQRLAGGSLPVYAVGESLVLKLYPPFDRPAWKTESLALQIVEGRLPIPTPSVQAAEEFDGWGYLLMGRLPGLSLAAAWPDIAIEDRPRLADALGVALAGLHSLRDPRMDSLRIDWAAFIEAQRRGCVERQRARGLDEQWLRQIPGFLEATPLGQSVPDCLLHTEIMREHLLVEPGPDGWRLSGLFDFEPAMVGAPEYEFAAAGLFVSCGDPVLFRRILVAYGYGADQLDSGLSRRLMAYTLLHRYSNLAGFLRWLPPPPDVRTLEGLAESWWGIEDAHVD